MDRQESTRPPARVSLSGALWLHPDDDLAPNRPGEALRAGPAPSDAHRRGRRGHRDRLWAEERVGAAWDGLTALGWLTLHAIPLPGGVHLAHLVIGPGGVFAVRAARCPDRPVTVDEDALRWRSRTGRPCQEPEPRFAHRAAVRAEHALTRGHGRPVTVAPVVALAGPSRVRPTREERGTRPVLVLREAEITAFGARAGVLRPDVVEALFAVARDRRAWRGV